jgi:hypothetical protein
MLTIHTISMRRAWGSALRLTSIFQDTGIPPGECLDMLRVRLFPGFSTAVLQTGPLTLGVRLFVPENAFYELFFDYM